MDLNTLKEYEKFFYGIDLMPKMKNPIKYTQKKHSIGH